MHGWVPIRVSAHQVELVFDSAVRVRIDPTKVKEREAKGAAEVELVDELIIGKVCILIEYRRLIARQVGTDMIK